MELHFEGLTNYEIELNSQSTKKYMINLLDNHKLCVYGVQTERPTPV